jgi:hypothetical protein
MYDVVRDLDATKCNGLFWSNTTLFHIQLRSKINLHKYDPSYNKLLHNVLDTLFRKIFAYGEDFRKIFVYGEDLAKYRGNVFILFAL